MIDFSDENTANTVPENHLLIEKGYGSDQSGKKEDAESNFLSAKAAPTAPFPGHFFPRHP